MATATTSPVKAKKKTDYPKQINKTLAKISPWWIYGFGLVPAAYYFYRGAINDLGANPIQTFEHLLGEWALRFMILVLLVTPLCDLTRVNLYRFRRAFGLLVFYYVLFHFLTYFILDRAMNLPVIFVDIFRRPYIILGMTAFLGLIALAATSNNWSIRRLGSWWGKLHRLVYVIATLGVIHFFMAVKSWPPRPFFYATVIGVLLVYRLVRFLLDQRRVVPA
jgi:methionine sulfoxide reductase heme-binding subunit